MANHNTENAVFNDKLRKFKTTDKGHADIFNAVNEQLINNDVALKTQIEQSQSNSTTQIENISQSIINIGEKLDTKASQVSIDIANNNINDIKSKTDIATSTRASQDSVNIANGNINSLHTKIDVANNNINDTKNKTDAAISTRASQDSINTANSNINAINTKIDTANNSINGLSGIVARQDSVNEIKSSIAFGITPNVPKFKVIAISSLIPNLAPNTVLFSINTKGFLRTVIGSENSRIKLTIDNVKMLLRFSSMGVYYPSFNPRDEQIEFNGSTGGTTGDYSYIDLPFNSLEIIGDINADAYKFSIMYYKYD